MVDYHVQASFNAGEWAPALNARVDMQKYRSGAALLENFFVDYRGGASSRPGTKYVIRCLNSSKPVRLINFQASLNVGYCLEFGDFYIRFMFDGAAVLETAFAITGASQANPCVVIVVGNNYAIGDWVYITGVVGMTQLNNRYFIVSAVAGNNVTLSDLNGNNIDSTAYTAYTSGGTIGRVYTIGSPFAAVDLHLLKFAQVVNQMIICHPNYTTQILTLITSTNWTIGDITIGSTVQAPTGLGVATSLGAGNTSYSYVVTTIDQNGQESQASAPSGLINKQDIRSIGGSNEITWTPVLGAKAYNVYESSVSYFGVAQPAGIEYGFIGATTQAVFIDDNIGPDYSQTPPVAGDPFIGGGIESIIVTAYGSYTHGTGGPTVALSGGSPTVDATIGVALGVITRSLTSTLGGFVPGDVLQFNYGITMIVATVDGSGHITSLQPIGYPGVNRGYLTQQAIPANPLTDFGGDATCSFTWGVIAVPIISPGFGYSSAPTVVFSGGGAAAVATVSPLDMSNPSVPSFFQQRLVFANTNTLPQTFWTSRPGFYFNFDTSLPTRDDDSIMETLVSNVLSAIKYIVASTAGMLLLTDKGSWLVNGGSSGSAISPTAIVANPQSFVGCSDVPPIVANYDVLHVQSKGSGVRDLAYNIYFSVFTGTDISVLSSHLFFNHSIIEWAWAEFPFYVIWAVREDGVMLTLTFLKEQDFVGWSHHVTAGLFKSVAAVAESTATAGNVDAIYTVVQRTVGGNNVSYIERIAERTFPNGAADAWCVDAALQYSGPPTANFSGAEHLAGLTCTGLADGVIIPPFVMPASGMFTLSAPASKVTVGLGFTCKLQTLALDVTDDRVQGRVKKISAVNVRVSDTINLKIGPDFDHLIYMKDLIVGNVSTTLTGQENQVITGLTTGDAWTALQATYTVPGQYCLEQSDPYPATVLGVFPDFTIGAK